MCGEYKSCDVGINMAGKEGKSISRIKVYSKEDKLISPLHQVSGRSLRGVVLEVGFCGWNWTIINTISKMDFGAVIPRITSIPATICTR